MSRDRNRGTDTAIATALMRYVWGHTKRQQAWLLFIVLLSLPTYFLAFELPKRIINGPIQGAGFTSPDSAQRPFNITIEVPSWLSPSRVATQLSDPEFSRSGMLIALSLLFLLLVVINGLFKLYINTYKGRLGERMLRRLRFALVDRVLRFPISRFKRTRSSEIATMVKDEVEPLGSFIGDAYVQPLYLGAQAATALIFIVVQDLWLGLMASGIVAVQLLIIPKLRRRLIKLGTERQLTARKLAGRVGEIVDGIQTIRLNDVSHYERAELTARLGKIYSIRYDIYRWKFLIKFLNNFLAQVTPFLFYAIGGYLVIKGRLDIGQLVAVIAAYRDLPPPLRELIDWDQQRIDAQVKFAQVIQQFSGDDLLDPAIQQPVTEPVAPVLGPIEVLNLAIVDDAGVRLIERATLILSVRDRVAVVGRTAGDSEALADALARLQLPSSGRITIDKVNLNDLSEATTGRRFSYAGPDAFLPQATVRETLLYVLKHVPVREASYDPASRKARERELTETRRSGNSLLDIRADWVDYGAAGVKDEAELLQHIRQVAHVAGLSDDIVSFGLRGFIDPDQAPERARQIVQTRKELHRRLSSPGLAGLVDIFDDNSYNREATVAENLLFGNAVGLMFSARELHANKFVRQILVESGLDVALCEMGREIAATAIEMFEDLAPDNPFFGELSFMEPEQVSEYKTVLLSIQGMSAQAVAQREYRSLVPLSFAYVETRHRMGLLDDSIAARIVAARHMLRQRLPAEYKDLIEFHDPDRYIKSASLLDNILFGRVAHGIAGGPERVLSTIRTLLRELALEDLVFDAGLEFNIGHGGSRLSAAQRQKIGVARALIKRPDYAIFKHPLSALNLGAQEDIMRAVLQHSRDPEHPFGILWVTSTAEWARFFDKVAIFENGVVAGFEAPAQSGDRGDSRSELPGQDVVQGGSKGGDGDQWR